MSGFEEKTVREYFERNGFFVRPWTLERTLSGKKQTRTSGGIVVHHPGPRKDPESRGFQLFSGDMAAVRAAVVVVRAPHVGSFSPALLKNSSRMFTFLKKEVLGKEERLFPAEESGELKEVTGCADSSGWERILVLPGLPVGDPHRGECIELLRTSGVDGMIAFSTVLENLLRQVRVNQSYGDSDLLELLRVLKIYDLVKEPQMQLFGQ